MLSGARDPIATPAEAARLKSALQTAGAAVEHRVLPVGHELSQSDVAIAHQWLQERRRNEGAGTAAIGQQPIC
jgi:phospholipase/carboxylesterase